MYRENVNSSRSLVNSHKHNYKNEMDNLKYAMYLY